MNRLNITLAALLAIFMINTTSAQPTTKEVKQALKLKVPSEVKKQAKTYDKEGYYVAIGAPTLERQLTLAWMKEMETDEAGFEKYITGNGQSVGETQIAAKLQATEAAKLDLAGKLSSNIAALIENNFANAQLNTQEATSVTQTIAAAKNLIVREIGLTTTLVELYKDIDKNIEANVRLAYDRETAMNLAKTVVREQLENETKLLQDKLDQLMKF